MSVEFSPPSAVPGEEVNLKLKALPNSLCGVSAIDQSVLILEPGETMTADMVNARTKFNQDIFVKVLGEAQSDQLEGGSP